MEKKICSNQKPPLGRFHTKRFFDLCRSNRIIHTTTKRNKNVMIRIQKLSKKKNSVGFVLIRKKMIVFFFKEKKKQICVKYIKNRVTTL